MQYNIQVVFLIKLNMIDLEYEKSLILKEAQLEKECSIEKYSNLYTSTGVVKYNARAVPLTLLNDKNQSCLLYLYLQKHSYWDKDDMTPYRYVWREDMILTTIESKLQGHNSRVSSRRVVSNKLKLLAQNGYIKEYNNHAKIFDMWVIGQTRAFSLISMKLIDIILKYNDELMARAVIWYCYMQYRNGIDNHFVCVDKTLCKYIDYSYSSKNRQRLHDIRELLIKEYVLSTLEERRRDRETGMIKTQLALKITF